MTDNAYEANLETRSLPAAADLSTKQYYAVLVNSSGQVALCGDDGEFYGVLQDKPAAAGRAACVAVRGVSRVVLGGTVAQGALVNVDSAGKIVTVATGDRHAVGVCLVGGGAGDIGSIDIRPQSVQGRNNLS